MLKKLIKRGLSGSDNNNNDNTIFPKPDANNGDTNTLTSSLAQSLVNSVANSLSNSPDELNKSSDVLPLIANQVLNNNQFIHLLVTELTPQILTILCERYDFEPTDKYKTEIDKRKQYLNQLDLYLEERKAINATVESDLKNFLNDTSQRLNESLNIFTATITDKIKDAEARYGIDSIKKAVLGVNTIEGDTHAK